MSLDSLTVCITSFKRGKRLNDAIASCVAAGITRLTICAVLPDGEVEAAIRHWKDCRAWTSFDVATYAEDIGCNQTWMVAAYLARTKRIIILHDDDMLSPAFGQAYETVLGPALDERKAGFVSWKPELKFDDGHTEPCSYWEGPSTLMPSHHLLKVVNNREGFSLSPVVSVLNRAIVIRACKEAGEELMATRSYLHPGMLLGTEIVVYLRHIEAFKRWLYVDQVLSYYGSHDESGTIKAQKQREHLTLITGYNLARDVGSGPAKEPTPRLILVYSPYLPRDPVIAEKQRIAQESWRWHATNGDVILLPLVTEKMPRLRELLDYGCQFALPEDIVLYANLDAGLTSDAAERIVAGVKRGNGVTCLFNRSLNPVPGKLYKNITNYRAPGGIEIVAMQPSWWRLHREKMPDMYIGRQAWDSCFAQLAEEWADGPREYLNDPDARLRSKAHTDDVCWHQDHFSEWQERRLVDPANLHNRQLAVAFFRERGNSNMLDALK
jgi:hypothetical protein